MTHTTVAGSQRSQESMFTVVVLTSTSTVWTRMLTGSLNAGTTSALNLLTGTFLFHDSEYRVVYVSDSADAQHGGYSV